MVWCSQDGFGVYLTPCNSNATGKRYLPSSLHRAHPSFNIYMYIIYIYITHNRHGFLQGTCSENIVYKYTYYSSVI